MTSLDGITYPSKEHLREKYRREGVIEVGEGSEKVPRPPAPTPRDARTWDKPLKTFQGDPVAQIDRESGPRKLWRFHIRGSGIPPSEYTPES